MATARAHAYKPTPEAPPKSPDDAHAEGIDDPRPQPKRSEKKNASKSAASDQLGTFLEEMNR